MGQVLAVLLAGGAGERLGPLTRRTAKPAVPFGGIYRIIDFTLSNCVNSGIRRIFCLAQYKSLELTRHLREGWNLFAGEMGEFIEVLHPMQRMRADWYLGTADAVYQNIESIEQIWPSEVLVTSSDHIYKMDYMEMVAWHRAHWADATIATIRVPPEQAPQFGIARIEAETHRILGFQEKPSVAEAVRSGFDAEMVSASMGVYVFKTRALLDTLRADAADETSRHDFGSEIIPRLAASSKVVAFDFHDLNAKKSLYWRDVGTIDAYYDANLDLVSVNPEFNLYDTAWPLRTRMPQAPPAKFVFAQEGRRMGIATDSIVSPGVIISGGRVNLSVLSPGVRVNSYSEVERSILLDGAQVGRYCRVRRAILDAGVMLPEGSIVGEDPERDRAAGHFVTDNGITVVSNAPPGRL
jgi:glucose-1-phosphate adenylyltransferase